MTDLGRRGYRPGDEQRSTNCLRPGRHGSRCGRDPLQPPEHRGRRDRADARRRGAQRPHRRPTGPYSARVEALLGAEIGAADVLLTTSCTAALEMSALMLDIGPGDTVVVPSFGFVTTALAFVRQGAQVLFCDIDEQTLGLDPRHLAELMDDSVRAVVPIHYAGVACDVDGIRDVLARLAPGRARRGQRPRSVRPPPRGARWAASEGSRPSASTRPRTSSVARAAH